MLLVGKIICSFPCPHCVGGGGQGGPNLPPPVPCNPGSRPFFLGFLPFAIFRLQNIMQCCIISPYFSHFPCFWNSHLPPFFLSRLPYPLAPYSPGLPPPCPPPTTLGTHQKRNCKFTGFGLYNLTCKILHLSNGLAAGRIALPCPCTFISTGHFSIVRSHVLKGRPGVQPFIRN